MRHIFYHKVPKTGSSTFSSILSRMIFKHNLTTYSLRRNYPHPYALIENLGQMPSNDSSGYRFDMQVTHGTFNKQTLERVMQKDTIYISTLRHPFRHLVSRFFYHYKKHGLSYLKTEFDQMLRTVNFQREKSKATFNDTKYDFLENPMFKYFELNYLKAQFNYSYFSECITEISSLFHVIITDRYDESLLLLRHKLCWDIKEIIYISHKNASFSEKRKHPSEFGILYENHQKISSLDYKLYSHFLEIHQNNVEAAGKDFQDELEEYKRVKADAGAFCWDIYKILTSETGTTLKNMSSVLASELAFEGGKFWNAFIINGNDCVLMALCEADLLHARLALNYPITCQQNVHNFKYNHLFCAKENGERPGFAYENLHFPYSAMRELLLCDLVVEYN